METTATAYYKEGTKDESSVDIHVFSGDGSILLGCAGYTSNGSYTVHHCWISLENLENLVKVAKQARKATPRKMRKFEDEWRAEKSTFRVEEGA